MIRFKAEQLVEKLLSFKFVIFIITTILRCVGVIGNAEWLTVTTVVLAGHEGQKSFGKYLDKERKENVAAD